MNKSIFGFFAFTIIFFTSCGSDDSNDPAPQNSNPSEVTLKAIESNPSVSYNFEWNAATDQDGDTVVYDFYVNDAVVASDLVETMYSLSVSNLDGISFPLAIKVVAKDGKEGNSTSNALSINDPILGKWNTVSLTDDMGQTIIAGECQKRTILEFKNDNTFTNTPYIEIEGQCIIDGASSSVWNYIKVGEYDFNEGEAKVTTLVSFEDDNLIIKIKESPAEVLVYTKAN